MQSPAFVKLINAAQIEFGGNIPPAVNDALRQAALEMETLLVKNERDLSDGDVNKIDQATRSALQKIERVRDYLDDIQSHIKATRVVAGLASE